MQSADPAPLPSLPALYPELPRTAADLKPLPQCPGPKLAPFDFQGPQKIEFLEKLGEGLHSIVFKVRILGEVYALKVFRWIWEDYWTGWVAYNTNHEHPDGLPAKYNYSEPFNLECRAYGRLQEAGCDDLAVRCFGYVLLDEHHERALMAQFNFNQWTFDGDIFEGGRINEYEQRLLYGPKDGRPPPLRCLVKALTSTHDCLKSGALGKTLARRYLRDIIKLQKLGIVDLDVRLDNLMGGKHSDFSTASTLPHPMMSPELNPHLSPEQIRELEKNTFVLSTNDYVAFDEMIEDWNTTTRFFPEPPSPPLSVEAFPGGRGCLGREWKPRYDLRRGRPVWKSLYTLADPRKYNRWIADGSSSARSGRPRRITKSVARRSVKPTGRPDIWYDKGEREDPDFTEMIGQPSRGQLYPIRCEYRDGYLFPVVKR